MADSELHPRFPKDGAAVRMAQEASSAQNNTSTRRSSGVDVTNSGEQRSSITMSFSIRRRQEMGSLPPSLRPRRPDTFIRHRFADADDNKLLSSRSRTGYAHAEASFKMQNSHRKSMKMDPLKTISSSGKQSEHEGDHNWLLVKNGPQDTLHDDENVDSEEEPRLPARRSSLQAKREKEKMLAQLQEEQRLEARIKESGKFLGFESFHAKPEARDGLYKERRSSISSYASSAGRRGSASSSASATVPAPESAPRQHHDAGDTNNTNQNPGNRAKGEEETKELMSSQLNKIQDSSMTIGTKPNTPQGSSMLADPCSFNAQILTSLVATEEDGPSATNVSGKQTIFNTQHLEVPFSYDNVMGSVSNASLQRKNSSYRVERQISRQLSRQSSEYFPSRVVSREEIVIPSLELPEDDPTKSIDDSQSNYQRRRAIKLAALDQEQMQSNESQELMWTIQRVGIVSSNQTMSMKRTTVDDARLHLCYANMLIASRDYRSALRHCVIATKLSPELPQAYIKRAQVLSHLGLWTDVYRDCTRALECYTLHQQNPRHEWTAKFLRAHACTKLLKPRFAEAVKDLLELNSVKSIPPGLRSHIFYALAEAKRSFALQGNRKKKEILDILDWALEDTTSLQELLTDTKAMKDARQVGDRPPHQLRDALQLEARLKLDYYSLTFDPERLEESIQSLTRAYKYGNRQSKPLRCLIAELIRGTNLSKACEVSSQVLNSALEHQKGSDSGTSFESRSRHRQTLMGTSISSPKRPPAKTNRRANRMSMGRLSVSRKLRAGETNRERNTNTDGTAYDQLVLTARLLRARAYACRSDFVRSEEDLRSVLQAQPSHIIAACFLAEVLACKGQYDRAQRVLTDVTIRNTPLSTSGCALILRVRHNLFIACGKLDEALRDLQKLNGRSYFLDILDPTERVYSMLRYAELRLDYLSDGEGALGILRKIHDDVGAWHAKKHLVTALAYIAFKKPKEALVELSKVIYAGTEINPRYYLLRAFCCASIERTEDAVQDLVVYANATLSKNEAERDLLMNKLSVVAKVVPRSTLEALDEAHRKRPSVDSLRLCFEALSKIAQHEKQPLHSNISYITELVAYTEAAVGPFDGMMAFTAGQCLHQVGNLNEALKWYSYALPKLPKPRMNGSGSLRSKLLLYKGSCEAQLAMNQERSGSKANPSFSLSIFTSATKSWTSASQDKSPEAAVALLHLGDLHMVVGHPRTAITFFDKVIDQVGDHASVHVRRGSAYAAIKHYGHALEAMNKAVAADVNHLNAWYNLGVLYENVENVSRANFAYVEALRIDNAFLFARVRKAITELQLQNPHQALQDLEIAYSSHTGSLLVIILIAHCCLELRQFQRAMRVASQGQAQLLDSPQQHSAKHRAVLRMIEGAACVGMSQLSLSQFSRMKWREITRSGEVDAEKSKLTRLERAKSFLKEAVYMDPAHQVSAQINLGLCDILAHKPYAASASFKVALQMQAHVSTPDKPNVSQSMLLQSAVSGLAYSFLLSDQPLQAHIVLEAFQCASESQLPVLRLARAVSLHAGGHMKAACEVYRDLVDQNDQNVSLDQNGMSLPCAELFLLSAAASLRHREAGLAQTLSGKILGQAQFSHHLAVRIVHGIALTMREMYDEAAQSLESLESIKSKNGFNKATRKNHFFLLFNRATLHGQVGNAPKSLRDCEAALQLDPSAIALRLLKAHMLVQQRRTKEALEAFQEVFDMYNNDALLNAVTIG